jgi:subtilisin family serine protease
MSSDPAVDLLPAVDHFSEDDGLPAVDQHVVTEPDFWIDQSLQTDLDTAFDGVEQMLTEAHNLTGWFNVKNNYGFTGLGQTVAVIDSGIAWNHFALGGGMGQGYRVVGGWDFSDENDSNPYDDGTSGGHGTHVSGIIGSSNGTNTGVAPGVDLVGLRVFNDSGQGFFSWIENALRWVHTNRNSFANPITAVNMSLGVSSWNSATIPAWANLEDELAQLKADGIFIAVSAGNSFSSTPNGYTTFNTTGLSYPAASPYVVPVMSTNDAGQMSAYSQRMTRGIAAPGQSIVSTAPDYKGNNNGVADDWVQMSGTSMAAPYVAGASVLIRQAMQFVGMTNINQDTIYNHMMATADTFYDAATAQNYKRLNLGRAIDTLMPADDYGSTAAAAHNLGTMSGSTSTAGRIGQLTDVDCFQFTAAANGRVTFTTTGSTGFSPSWQLWGATATSQNGGTIWFNVVAGQTYTVGLSSPTAMATYTLASAFESTFTATDWGSVANNTINDVSVSGERWFRITAPRTGFVTVQGMFNAAAGNVNLAIYNTSMQQLAAGTTNGGIARVDYNGVAGGEYYVRVTGTNADVDFKLQNLVSQSGLTVSAIGTTGADVFAFAAGSTNVLTVNGVGYAFASGSATTFNVDGLGGADAFTVTGTTGNDGATIRLGSIVFTGGGTTVNGSNFETQSFVGSGGDDTAILYDSVGTDTYTATPTYATLTGTGFSHRVDDVDNVTAYSNSGGAGQNDLAYLYGSNGDDRYVGRTVYSVMEGAGFKNIASGFDRVDAFAQGGTNDQAFIYDSTGDDMFTGRPEYAMMTGTDYYNVARGFDRAEGISSLGGYDRAYLYDSVSDDVFVGRPDYAYISGTGYYNFARGFDRVDGYAFAAGGVDRAYLYDSAGNDTFVGRPTYSLLSGTGFYNLEWSFEVMYSFATGGGRDIAYMYDSAGDDRYVAGPESSYMVGTGFYYYVQYFEDVYAYAFAGGNDTATFTDSAGNDLFSSSASGVTMRVGTNLNTAYSFKDNRINATAGGSDRLTHGAVVTADAYFGRTGSGTLTRVGSRVESTGIEEIVLSLSTGATPTIDNDSLDYVFTQVGA